MNKNWMTIQADSTTQFTRDLLFVAGSKGFLATNFSQHHTYTFLLPVSLHTNIVCKDNAIYSPIIRSYENNSTTKK